MMEYTVQKLARLAGVSARTLRFYAEIGLLPPERVTEAGYRIYGPRQVDALQQILFYRELGLGLSAIAEILADPAFDRVAALKAHLARLQDDQARMGRLIHTVQRTIQSEEGGIPMRDKEKFEGFKKALVEENERKYGKEIREKYGEQAVNESNASMMNLTQAEYDAMQALGAELQEKLERAVRERESPAGETGKSIALLHKRWLGYTWGHYSPSAHAGLAQMYVDDDRFTAYYDKQVSGCAQFLRDAVHAAQATLA